MRIYTVRNLVNDWVHVVWWNAYYINWESHNIFYEWTICVRRDFWWKSLQKESVDMRDWNYFDDFHDALFEFPDSASALHIIIMYIEIFFFFILFALFKHQFYCQLLCTIVHKNSILTLTPSSRLYFFCVCAMTMPCLCSPQVINT